MRIQNNITASNSHRNLGISHSYIAKNAEKLSSGYRVNRAADDAAGLAISEKMRTQIKGLNRASLNIQDGCSLLQVGDGALQSMHNKMQRLRELSVQSANGTNELLDREAIQLEFGQLASEINEVALRTNFNGKYLFNGDIGAPYEYNLGISTTPYTTTIAADNDFNGPINIPGWAPQSEFGVAWTTGNMHQPGFTFPTSGVFAMQIVTPADGTLNVVLDFGVANSAGTMDRDSFLNYFRNGFNDFELGKVVENITYDPFLGRIIFDFPKASNGNLTGVMGKPGTIPGNSYAAQPRVFVGVGPMEGPFATLPIYGGEAQQAILNGDTDTGAPWVSEPIRTFTNRGPIDSSTTFVNSQILGGTGYTEFPPIEPHLATPPSGGFPSVTIKVDGKPTTITLQPGDYTDVQSFIDANKRLFETAMPRGFDLVVDENGKLNITTKIVSGATEPTVEIDIKPTTLGTQLGFGSEPKAVTERDEEGNLYIQSGANEGDGQYISMPRLCARSLGLAIRRPEDTRDPEDGGFEHINGLGADGYVTVANVAGDPMEYSLSVLSHETAAAAITVLTNAINIISTERAQIGAQQNRMEYAMLNVDNAAENLSAAESRIRDTDMAKEMTTFVKNQILVQSGTAMLSQANAIPQGVLQLLG